MCAADALFMLDATGCAGIAVARGAMGRPWIFEEIRAALEGLSLIHISNAANFSGMGVGFITSVILPSICKPLKSTNAVRLSSL